ncbi:hypothetical protein BaRGS_00035049, partial [Batillaria attramentaria]
CRILDDFDNDIYITGAISAMVLRCSLIVMTLAITGIFATGRPDRAERGKMIYCWIAHGKCRAGIDLTASPSDTWPLSR